MPEPLLEILQQGGCYWKRERFDRPGHSTAIRAGTRFKIAVDGQGSNVFVEGICEDGQFKITHGPFAGTYASAHEAVNSVREPSSNAFLYIHFQLPSGWVSADALRRDEDTNLDQIDELALEEATQQLRRRPTWRSLSEHELMRKAAEVATQPNIQKIASVRATISDIDV
jgi:hypothetical protein